MAPPTGASSNIELSERDRRALDSILQRQPVPSHGDLAPHERRLLSQLPEPEVTALSADWQALVFQARSLCLQDELRASEERRLEAEGEKETAAAQSSQLLGKLERRERMARVLLSVKKGEDAGELDLDTEEEALLGFIDEELKDQPELGEFRRGATDGTRASRPAARGGRLPTASDIGSLPRQAARGRENLNITGLLQPVERRSRFNPPPHRPWGDRSQHGSDSPTLEHAGRRRGASFPRASAEYPTSPRDHSHGSHSAFALARKEMEPAKLAKVDPNAWKNFKRNFRVTAKLNGWDNDTAILKLEWALRDEAAQVTEHLDFEDLSTLEEALAAVEDLIIHPSAGDLAESIFESATKKAGEDLLTWHTRLRSLHFRAFPHAFDLKPLHKKFINGLGHPGMIQQLAATPGVRDYSYTQLLHRAQDIQAAYHRAREAPKAKDRAVAAMGPSKTSAPAINAPRGPCYYCRQQGHYQADCPRKAKGQPPVEAPRTAPAAGNLGGKAAPEKTASGSGRRRFPPRGGKKKGGSGTLQEVAPADQQEDPDVVDDMSALVLDDLYGDQGNE